MDDNTDKVKQIKNFFTFYKFFIMISSIATILISIIIKVNIEDDEVYLDKFIENWNKKPIQDVKFLDDCPNNYETQTLANWPVNSRLCDCRNSTFYINNIIKPYPCNFYLKFVGCTELSEMKNFNINFWKSKKICVQRSNQSYINSLINSKCDNNCSIIDTVYKKTNVCSDVCPISNGEIQRDSDIFSKIIDKEFVRRRYSKMKKSMFLYNLTTYKDLEILYHKDFNITRNNKRIERFTSSDIFISENFPCLIGYNNKPNNQVNKLFDFYLKNIDLIHGKVSSHNTHNISFKINTSIFNDINLNNLDKKDCYIYENTYFDKRYYLLDIISFNEFLLLDIEYNSLETVNLSLTMNNYSVGEYDKFSPNTTLFLVSSPFYSWNINSCDENPGLRMTNIKFLYEKVISCFGMLVVIKIICIVYLFIHGIFENYSNFKNFYNSFYTLGNLLYYITYIVKICLLLQICFMIKKILIQNFLFIIRNDCMDENSTKIINYLYDSCDEKFIYSLFVFSFTLLEFIIFTIIFTKSYFIKLNLN